MTLNVFHWSLYCTLLFRNGYLNGRMLLFGSCMRMSVYECFWYSKTILRWPMIIFFFFFYFLCKNDHWTFIPQNNNRNTMNIILDSRYFDQFQRTEDMVWNFIGILTIFFWGNATFTGRKGNELFFFQFRVDRNASEWKILHLRTGFCTNVGICITNRKSK